MMISDTSDDDTEIDTDVEQPAPPPPAVSEAIAIAFDLIALAADPRTFEARLTALRRARAKIRTAAKKLAADRAAFEEYKSAAEAEIEPQRRSAARIYELAQSRERDVERREAAVELAEKRCRELGLDPAAPAFDARNFRPPGSFQPIEGTSIGQVPERLPPPDEPIEDASEAPAAVRRGAHDATDFPPDTTLGRIPDPEETVGVRIRTRRRGATQAGA
jgi:hypothetical protein